METSSELKYCPCCMELDNIEESGFCPHCSHELGSVKNEKEDLPIYTVIDNRYMVGKVKDHADDSNIYIGLDLANKKKVWIKEFFYRSLVYRNRESTNIQIYAGQKETYLKKYDACVREYQKLKDDREIVFSNGTIYKIIPLSEEEIPNALYQNPNPVKTEAISTDQNAKKEEKLVQQQEQKGKKISTNLISSKKVKIAVIMLLTICLIGSVLQKYDFWKIFGQGKKTESASVSIEKKNTPAPTKKAVEVSSMPESQAPSVSLQVSFSPSPEPTAEVNHAKSTIVPKCTSTPKKRKKSKSIKHATPMPTKRSVETRKPIKKPVVTKKPKKSKNTIDDSTVDNKVYEIK